MITETKENQTQTGLKNFKPKINLNHNIYMVHGMKVEFNTVEYRMPFLYSD